MSQTRRTQSRPRRSPQRVKFGRIVASLRKEQKNDSGDWWRQETLAQRLGVTTELIGRIERGEAGELGELDLIKLADAFKLTSAERRLFFLAASDVEQSNIPATRTPAEQVLETIVGFLNGTRIPFYVSDNFCDVIRANRIIARLLGLEQIEGTGNTVPAGFNVIKLVFGEELAFGNGFGYKDLIGRGWRDHAVYNIRYYRERTLPSRHDPYFDSLHKFLLKEVDLFRHYWLDLQYGQHSEFFVDDYFSGHIDYDYEHPLYGELRYLAAETVTVTSEGNLSTVHYVPQNRRTAAVFEELAEETRENGKGTDIIELSPWPDKQELMKLFD